jgi:hypothetical protein
MAYAIGAVGRRGSEGWVACESGGERIMHPIAPDDPYFDCLTDGSPARGSSGRSRYSSKLRPHSPMSRDGSRRVRRRRHRRRKLSFKGRRRSPTPGVATEPEALAPSCAWRSENHPTKALNASRQPPRYHLGRLRASRRHDRVGDGARRRASNVDHAHRRGRVDRVEPVISAGALALVAQAA